MCGLCEHTFDAVGPAAYCSELCAGVGKMVATRIRQQQRRALGLCPHHGVPGFCDACHAKNFNKGANRKRGFAKAGQTISAVDLAEQQKWACALGCGVKLSTKYPSGHNLSITIDHTIPISLGGTDDPANLTAAHRICNIRKGNRSLGPEQLRMIA
jgi:5-methylcytosine-specific restriction endonuclease McrA